MDTKNRLQYNEEKLMLEFVELLYKQKLINKETYYNAKQLIHWEIEQ